MLVNSRFTHIPQCYFTGNEANKRPIWEATQKVICKSLPTGIILGSSLADGRKRYKGSNAFFHWLSPYPEWSLCPHTRNWGTTKPHFFHGEAYIVLYVHIKYTFNPLNMDAINGWKPVLKFSNLLSITHSVIYTVTWLSFSWLRKKKLPIEIALLK